MRGRAAGWAAVAMLMAACARHPKEPPFTGEQFLLVWAGDADRQHADFLAVIDADPGSKTYGKVLKTYPVRSRGNEPQALQADVRADRRVFATGVLTNRTFVFDVRKPLAARLLRVDEPDRRRTLGAPRQVVSLPDGTVAVACAEPARYRNDPREMLTQAGGLVHLSADGEFEREVSAAGATSRGLIVAPGGATTAPHLDRLLTTSTAHAYAAGATGERMPGIAVQVWSLGDLSLLQNVVLEAGPRGEENLAPTTPRYLRKTPMVLVNTELGGALYASDSTQTTTPSFKLAYDFGTGTLPGGAAVTPDDRWYVTALAGTSRVVSLDLGDPWHPKPVSAVRLDRDPESVGQTRTGGPHWLAMSADGTRVAVSDYAVDVPTFVQDGDRRVYLLRLDPASGRLRVDGAFRDENSGQVGIDFNRTHWPHGDTGPARPAGLLFTTPAPPSKDGDADDD